MASTNPRPKTPTQKPYDTALGMRRVKKYLSLMAMPAVSVYEITARRTQDMKSSIRSRTISGMENAPADMLQGLTSFFFTAKFCKKGTWPQYPVQTRQ